MGELGFLISEEQGGRLDFCTDNVHSQAKVHTMCSSETVNFCTRLPCGLYKELLPDVFVEFFLSRLFVFLFNLGKYRQPQNNRFSAQNNEQPPPPQVSARKTHQQHVRNVSAVGRGRFEPLVTQSREPRTNKNAMLPFSSLYGGQ